MIVAAWVIVARYLVLPYFGIVGPCLRIACRPSCMWSSRQFRSVAVVSIIHFTNNRGSSASEVITQQYGNCSLATDPAALCQPMCIAANSFSRCLAAGCDAGQHADSGQTWHSQCIAAQAQVDSLFDSRGCPECVLRCREISCRVESQDGSPVCMAMVSTNPCLWAGSALILIAIFTTVALLHSQNFFADCKLSRPQMSGSSEGIAAAIHNHRQRKQRAIVVAADVSSCVVDVNPVALPSVPCTATHLATVVAEPVHEEGLTGMLIAPLHTEGLPIGWKRLQQNGQVYYFNPQLNRTQYEPPP